MDSRAVTSKTPRPDAGKGEQSHPETNRISIWFFIGMLLLIYGLLIFGDGIYDLIVPPAQQPVLANLHAAVWWGGLLTLLGGVYSYRFSPRKGRR